MLKCFCIRKGHDMYRYQKTGNKDKFIVYSIVVMRQQNAFVVQTMLWRTLKTRLDDMAKFILRL